MRATLVLLGLAARTASLAFSPAVRAPVSVIDARGPDARRFLHALLSNDLLAVPAQQGGGSASEPLPATDAMLLDAAGRCVDLLTVVARGDEDLAVLCASSREAELVALFEKYTFPADRVAFSVCDCAVYDCGDAAALGALAPDFCVASTTVSAEGFRAVVPGRAAEPADDAAWHDARIAAGRGWAGAELTSDYNPLEAGLWHATHFDKGCYVGAETVNKVKDRDAVKTRLFGLEFNVGDDPSKWKTPLPGDKLFTVAGGMQGNRPAGVVTSVASDGASALAYVRAAVGGAGLRLRLMGAGDRGPGATKRLAKVVDVPYPTRTFEDSPTGKQAEGAAPAAAAAAVVAEEKGSAEERAAEKQRKADKMAAMAAKVAAFKAKQG